MRSPYFRLNIDRIGSAGADPGFFLGGGAVVSCFTSTPINQVVFSHFCQHFFRILRAQSGKAYQRLVIKRCRVVRILG